MINNLIELSRIYKKIFLVTLDSLILIAVLLLAFALRLGYWFWPEFDLLLVIFGAPMIAIPIFFSFGLYHEVTRFFTA